MLPPTELAVFPTPRIAIAAAAARVVIDVNEGPARKIGTLKQRFRVLLLFNGIADPEVVSLSPIWPQLGGILLVDSVEFSINSELIVCGGPSAV